MTFEKMLRVMLFLQSDNGYVSTTSGGELMLVFNSQPSRMTHTNLLEKGFVCVDCDYIYRPRKRVKK